MFATAIQRNDLDQAQVAIAVLRQLDPTDLTLQFSSALVDYDKGDKEIAVRVIKWLADEKQLLEAAVWLLDHDFEIDAAESWSEEQADRFEKYAKLALTNDLTSGKAHNVLGRYYREIGELDSALSHFERLLSNDPEYSFVTAQLYKLLGDQHRAVSLARKFERYFADRLKRSPNVVSYRIKLAQLLVFQEREEAASQLLLDGFNYSQGQVQEYRIGAGEALVSKVRRLSEEQFSPTKFVQQVQLSKSSLVFAADSRIVVESANNLLNQIRENRNSEQEHLQNALVLGQYPEAVHFFVGLLGLTSNNPENSKLHLNMAMQSWSDLATILSSLALDWSGSPSNSAQALMLIEYVFEKDKRPITLAVRGQIYERIADSITLSLIWRLHPNRLKRISL